MTKKSVFFYGLFMDPELLQKAGLTPSIPVVAELQDYKLVIGERATLIPKHGTSCWGTIMQLDTQELDDLYAEPSVKDYQAVSVDCIIGEDSYCTVDVYILPEDYPLQPPKDSGYIDQLVQVSKKVNLPAEYQKQLSKMAEEIRNAS